MIDLNEITTETKRTFSDSIFDQMPAIFSEGLNVMTDQTEKSVFLMGALGVISGMLPNVYGQYDGHKVSPNLYIYVLGPYGSGKGALRYARKLGESIHREKTAKRNARPDNKIDSKLNIALQQLHFIPANNSKTGFFELLNINNGSGTLFESEGDTLADAIRQDYGNFSDGLRKAYHHEVISYYRRTNSEYVEIDKPCLSVILSSTFDQLKPLIPTPENGLFSRFCFFLVPPDTQFKNVFSLGKKNYESTFDRIGNKLKRVYLELESRSEELIFEFTAEQQSLFLTYFQKLKTDLQANELHALDGLVNRMGLQFFRIAMILCSLRHIEEGGQDRTLVCNEKDFQLSMQIVEVLKNNALDLYRRLPQPKDSENKHIEQLENIMKAKELHQAGQTYRQISETLFGKQTNQSTIYRWINQK